MKKVNFLGLNFQLGQEKKGLSYSAQYIRHYFDVLEKMGLQVKDQGSISSSQRNCVKVHCSKDLNNVDWSSYNEAYEKILCLTQKNRTLINWGGDHSVALATVGAFSTNFPTGYVLWIDAHADLNLPQFSLSGNLHGMPMSALLGLGNIRENSFPWIRKKLQNEKLIYLGLRDLDSFERDTIRDLKIKVYTSEDIKSQGMDCIANQIFDKVKNSPLHISFDIDSLSPEIAPSTGVPVPQGLSNRDLIILGKKLRNHNDLRSIDVVEINPFIGTDEEVFKTYISAINFILATLTQGGSHDDLRRSNQTSFATSMESRS